MSKQQEIEQLRAFAKNCEIDMHRAINNMNQSDKLASDIRRLIDGEVYVVEVGASLQPQAEDPMDWPLPCDVTVGHGTMSKGVKLRTLVARMKALYEMATGQNANEVEQRSLEKRQLMLIAALQPQAAEPNAPWLSEAHMLCSDQGIPHGDITERIEALRDKLAASAAGGPPERDQSRPAEQQGVFHKFNVQRTDGSDQPGGKHHGCEYFVLDVAHDQHAKPALEAYATACVTTHPQLSADMRERYGLQPQAADHIVDANKIAQAADYKTQLDETGSVVVDTWAATAPITCQYCHSDSGEVMWHCNNCGNKDQPYTPPPATQVALTAALESLEKCVSKLTDMNEAYESEIVDGLITEGKDAIAQIEALGVK